MEFHRDMCWLPGLAHHCLSIDEQLVLICMMSLLGFCGLSRATKDCLKQCMEWVRVSKADGNATLCLLSDPTDSRKTLSTHHAAWLLSPGLYRDNGKEHGNYYDDGLY